MLLKVKNDPISSTRTRDCHQVPLRDIPPRDRISAPVDEKSMPADRSVLLYQSITKNVEA